MFRDQAEISSHGSKVPIERPESASSHQCGCQQVNVDPADPPSAERAHEDQLQHLFIWKKWRSRKPFQIRDHRFPSWAETSQDESPRTQG